MRRTISPAASNRWSRWRARYPVFDQLRRQVSIVIVEHNLDLVLALADRVFALERGAVFHQGPAEPLLTNLDYRKQILWL